MIEEIEKRLLEQLRFKSGLDENKLSELIGYADQLFDRLERRPNTEISGIAAIPRWWIKGTPQVWDSIGFEVYLEKDQLLELVNRIDSIPKIKQVLNTMEISPGITSGPVPQPWKVTGSLGAGPLPDPWLTR